jgi:predicted peptidase
MMRAPEVSVRLTLQQTLKWATVGLSLSPAFFIVNFTEEIRRQKPIANIDTRPAIVVNVLTLYAFASTMLALVFGIMVSTQSASFLSWQKQNLEAARDVHARHYEPRIFVNKNADTTRYQLMRPLDYDSLKKYPLVLCLHHGGTHGTDNFSQLGADPAPYLESNRNKYPAFYLMPQCPKGFGWANIDKAIFAIIDELENEFPIDTSRRYVMGISGGGYGSWHFITTRPTMFAAAIPICGGGNPELAGKITSVSVWAFHGEDDSLVPVTSSREMIDGMKKAGGNPRYTEFQDAGHSIWNKVVTTPGLMDWLFEQRSDSIPK